MKTLNYLDTHEYMENIAKGMPPLIITVAITGGVAGKEVNPNLPESPEEQIDSAYEAYKAGAAMVHIHARDPETGYADPSTNPEHYYKINKLIRERCPDMIIANTCGVGIQVPRAEALRPLEAKPEMASLNCGPLNVKAKLKKRLPPLWGRDEDVDLSGDVIPFTFAETEILGQEMKKRGVKPELEVYNCQQFNVVDNLINKGLLEKPYAFSLIFSDSIAVPPTMQNFISMVAGLPSDSVFQAIGVGPAQMSVITMSIIIGGDVRVGFEDNIFYKRGELLRSNAQAVERVVRIANELGREIATPLQARRMLGISEQPSTYE